MGRQYDEAMKQKHDPVQMGTKLRSWVILFWIVLGAYFIQFEAASVELNSTTHHGTADRIFTFTNRNSITRPKHHVNSKRVKLNEVPLPSDKRLHDGSWITTYSSLHREVHKDNTTCPLYCLCNKTQRSVICYDGNLACIPEIPMYTTDLKILNANLPHITASSFTNLTNIGLISLSLIKCHIETLTEDAFEGITHSLEYLDLSYNQISIDQLQKSLYIFADRNLLQLKLSYMKLKHIPDDFFYGWQGSRLSLLNLDKNLLDQFSGHVIDPLHKLEWLSLRINNLTDINHIECLREIHTLDLSQNIFIKLPSFVANNGSKLLPNLHNLYIQENNIQSISVINFRGLDNLQSLTLNVNEIQQLPNNIMSEMPNLIHASFRSNIIHKLSSFSFNHSCLQSLDFGSNTYRFSTADAENIFKFCPSLTFLSLTNNKLDIDDATVKTILSPLKKLKRLIIDNTGLEFIPTTLLEALPNLYELILSENNIAYWKPDIFLPAKHLTRLYIDHCKIQIINKTSFPKKLWDHLGKVNFGGNPLSCTCDLLWFRDWLDTTNVTVVGWQHPFEYKCGSPQALQGTPLCDYHPTKEICTNYHNIYIILGASIGSVFMLTITITIVNYRYRWHIRYLCAVIKAKRRNYNTLLNQDYTHDAFVIYSSIDRAWVIEKLIPIVEYREGYKLCVQDRDFIPGRFIVDNIVESMESSRKVIIILSNNFAKSEWCKWEATMALHKFIDTGSDILALIMIESISPENLNTSLIQLLQRTYVDWEGMKNCQDLFWKQLLSALKLPEQNE